MAIRTDLYSIDYSASPRVINIDISVTYASAVDLYDTVSYIHALPESMDEPHIIEAEGKTKLDEDGNMVGLTVILINAVYAFAARPGPDWVICNMQGGNVVAVTDRTRETSIYPRKATAFVSSDRTSSVSATLQEQESIAYSAFQNHVWVDVVNGVPGTDPPIGDRQHPVNNILDAVTIDNGKFNQIGVLSDMEINSSVDLSHFLVEGASSVSTDIVIATGANVYGVVFLKCNISGILDGLNLLRNCTIGNLSYVNGQIHNSELGGRITLGGGTYALIANCNQLNPSVLPIIDMGITGQNLMMPDYSGYVGIQNFNSASNTAIIGISSGKVILYSDSVTQGTIKVSGDGSLEDENGNIIRSGTWNTGVTIENTTGQGNLLTQSKKIINTVMGA